MNEETEALINHALDSLAAARILIREKFFGYAAARAYYTMFYCAKALLVKEELQTSKHWRVISVFGEKFSKTQKLDQKFHRYLINAYRERITADYDDVRKISEDTAQRLINQANEFLETTLEFLERENEK